MAQKDQALIALRALDKTVAAMTLIRASVQRVGEYDETRTYSPEEREPYDALSDRFVRGVEVSLQLFRSYERLMFAENSDIYRDLLGRMAKLDIVTSVSLWVEELMGLAGKLNTLRGRVEAIAEQSPQP